MALLFYLKGSETGDLDTDITVHPFEPCPDSPNCIVVSKQFAISKKNLFSFVLQSIDEMKPHQSEADSQSLQIKAVFRIPVFFFKDDLKVVITEEKGTSVLHVKSSSRIGHGDLGVNRRRVQKLLSLIIQKF